MPAVVRGPFAVFVAVGLDFEVVPRPHPTHRFLVADGGSEACSRREDHGDVGFLDELGSRQFLVVADPHAGLGWFFSSSAQRLVERWLQAEVTALSFGGLALLLLPLPLRPGRTPVVRGHNTFRFGDVSVEPRV